MNRLEGATGTAMEWFRNNGMRQYSKKCHVVVCGHKHECMVSNIDNAQVIESLGIRRVAGKKSRGCVL